MMYRALKPYLGMKENWLQEDDLLNIVIADLMNQLNTLIDCDCCWIEIVVNNVFNNSSVILFNHWDVNWVADIEHKAVQLSSMMKEFHVMKD